MSLKDAETILQDFSNDCTRCQACLNSCSLLNNFGATPGEIAQAILNDHIDERIIEAVIRCDLCGSCSLECQENSNPALMIKAARQILIKKGKINPEEYDVMLVDREWNFFSIYRATYIIRYDDLFNDQFESLFFPGCTLATYAPELTRAAHQWLKQQGISLGFSEHCCGKPLDCIGLAEENKHHLDRLRSQIKSAGARRIITACPNCEVQLQSQINEVEVQSIYEIIKDAGIRSGGGERITFHDSCPDRYRGKNPADVRALLSGFTQVEMLSHGKDTICCGSGGIVSTIDPDLCTSRAQKRMDEFSNTGADTCITSCMACAHRLARVSQPGQLKHIFEILFGCEIDYSQIEMNIKKMWEGDNGELNLQRLSQVLPAPYERGNSGAAAG